MASACHRPMSPAPITAARNAPDAADSTRVDSSVELSGNFTYYNTCNIHLPTWQRSEAKRTLAEYLPLKADPAGKSLKSCFSDTVSGANEGHLTCKHRFYSRFPGVSRGKRLSLKRFFPEQLESV